MNRRRAVRSGGPVGASPQSKSSVTGAGTLWGRAEETIGVLSVEEWRTRSGSEEPGI